MNVGDRVKVVKCSYHVNHKEQDCGVVGIKGVIKLFDKSEALNVLVKCGVVEIYFNEEELEVVSASKAEEVSQDS